MDPKPQKPPFLFGNPFTMLTELTFKLWGFGKPAAEASAPEKPVTVAVIPATPHGSRKRAKGKARGKNRSKRARRAKA